MTQAPQEMPLLVLLIGATIVLAILLKFGLGRIGVPASVGYLLLGLLLRLIDQDWNLLSSVGQEIFEFLADVGIICLLFRVGLESKLEELINQMRRASLIWIGDVLVSGFLGFFTAYWLLELELIPSLFIGTAMTATSVGISVSVWREAEAVNSPTGELMLDVAEMDDISAIALMALLFSVVPVIQNGNESALLMVIAQTIGTFVFKAVIFGAVCFYFSRYAEQSITGFLRQFDDPADLTLIVAGIGFIFAALAGILGFSKAIGAFFAGLVFSRDPQEVKIDASFKILYDLFVPFFFISIGFQIDPKALLAGISLGVVLIVVAVLGKVLGAGLPALIITGWKSSTLLGISMMPRAEIAMLIMQQGLKLGGEVVSSQVFAAMVVVSAMTSISAPLVLRPLLQKWPQINQEL